MWSYYQAAIIKYIFIPFCIYLALLSYLSTTTVGAYIYSFDLDLSIEENRKEKERIKITAYSILGCASILFLFFVGLEINALTISGPGEYFSDIWNQIDTAQMILNLAQFIGFGACCICEKEVFSVELLRTFASLSTFFMWIKVFYWMRLFSSFAYYVKLIMQTIADSGLFMVMVGIIMFAFANFFLVINKNQLDTNRDVRAKEGWKEEDLESEYVNSTTGNMWLDAIIQIYLLGALGDFDITSY